MLCEGVLRETSQFTLVATPPAAHMQKNSAPPLHVGKTNEKTGKRPGFAIGWSPMLMLGYDLR